MNQEKTEIKTLSVEELKAALVQMGEKPFRARPIFKWLHTPVCSFDEMTDQSKALRERLAERFLLTVPQVERKQQSKQIGRAR